MPLALSRNRNRSAYNKTFLLLTIVLEAKVAQRSPWKGQAKRRASGARPFYIPLRCLARLVAVMLVGMPLAILYW
ncbi:hypothetical protein LX32DRAFT_179609 [Colletotrichum zoysiae]|uniref:Uncharacterized protein n=1 Tax=Colletotrichum zoysiae TaxID=1216348 RepID=A0AAD9HNS7_9PEZI|nr:hypothetical protein LX32DRAFT_179609 [Colletotrichum zoysiae]